MWFALINSVIWIGCIYATIRIKDTDCLGYALIATLIIGLGYLITGCV